MGDSLNAFRIGPQVQSVIWKITSGVLNLGNVNFMRTGDGYAQIDKKSMKYVQIVSDLWSIKASELEKRLTTKSLKVGKNNIVQKIQYNEAVSNRDSIAKGIYENIFLWLCKRINAELLVEDEENGKYFIGILDVFGFENFYFNSLEQFCINYTNEKLQQYFNHHIIASEQEEYLRESIVWTPLTVPDNEEYVQLVENNKNGFFALLDNACIGPSKNDTTAFMQLLFKKQGKNKCIKQAKKAGSGNWRGKKPKKSIAKARFNGFSISHFADDVTYDVSKFLIKNMESVHSDTNKMIKQSEESIFKEINCVNVSGKRKKRKKKSVTAVFYGGIKRLMKSLTKTEPYFVRCINPNKQKSKEIWTENIVEHQLRCGGLLEALKVLKLGYPTRVPYDLLYSKYHLTITNPLIKNMKPDAFSTSLLIAFDVNESDYELGLTKIFFKPSKAAVLDTIMSKAGEPLTKEQNDKITKYIVRKRCNQMLGAVKAFTTLHKMLRMKRAAKEWQSKGRITSILAGTVSKHLLIARMKIRKRKESEAAKVMQTYFRSCYERRQFINHVAKVKKATKIIQIAYDSMRQRQGLKEWIDDRVKQRNDKDIDIEPKPEAVVDNNTQNITVSISKQEQLKQLRAQKEEERRIKKEEEDKRLIQEINARIESQENASINMGKIKQQITENEEASNKQQRDDLIEQNREERKS